MEYNCRRTSIFVLVHQTGLFEDTYGIVANISEKIRETRLRWLGHVERNTED